jgi:hypothetical protein
MSAIAIFRQLSLTARRVPSAAWVNDILQQSQNEWSFDHKDEHKPDHGPCCVSSKHNGECSNMHRKDSREGKPENTESKIIPVLSENKPEQSACPK